MTYLARMKKQRYWFYAVVRNEHWWDRGKPVQLADRGVNFLVPIIDMPHLTWCHIALSSTHGGLVDSRSATGVLLCALIMNLLILTNWDAPFDSLTDDAVTPAWFAIPITKLHLF